jgi:biopolymer transport protein ExbB
MLATMGATSPFIGLLGTVWGIYHALISLAQAGQYTLDKVAQPVGESLVMTAAGLGVAIPAVMAYNLLGRRLAAMDATLDALAFDLRAYFLSQAR